MATSRTAESSWPESVRIEVSEADALALLGHLVASAELCMTEPYDYGIFRLIDAASRLGALLAPGADIPERAWLEDFVAMVDRGKMDSIRNRERYLAFLVTASRAVAEHLADDARAGHQPPRSGGPGAARLGTDNAGMSVDG